ncbi:hypothetical protein SCLCIDRAFT_100715 [Scleroderma citrinum Foug A]|uniref:NTF2 domain-containing protein n=1 Tax=Scleroderma citrinum Foug A TaxID=1036808 RepID=A0A0C3AA67_9AGAM|nr:hypothetical protein SCLCIDRAFT_100715 [Scleroderma citrinum Foug A]
MSTSPSTTIHQNVVPSEVGWQFVPQYYTFVNKQPNRLHCFYTKTSTFSHGMEGEDIKPCFGQQEIHSKITSIGFQDCKVFIHSVDAQSSANGGIIIQVIGEMSNHSDPWKKFVQTFFLAEQPNGYFVLNDIFRFLKEESTEDDLSEEQPTSEQPVAEPVVASVSVTEPEAAPVSTPAPPPEPTPPSPAPLVEEEPTTVNPQPPTPPLPAETKLPEANGIHSTESEPQSSTPSVQTSPTIPAAETAPEPAPLELEPTPQPQAPPTTSPAPPPQPPMPAPQQSQPPLQPQPHAPTPAKPRSWATLAATDSNRWGSAVAQESKGLTEVPASSSSPAPAPGTHSPAPHGHRGGQHHGPREYPAVTAVHALTTPQCFVKGVVDPVTNAQLSQVLTQRFGALKEMEVVRAKACAFLEFTSLDAAKKAIIASLPQNQGGEGGIRIDVGGEAGSVRIVVETRKERGERPQSRPRGGGPMNGDSRGGFRGRGGAGGRGRGGPPPGK